MTGRISTDELRKLLAEYRSGSPKAAVDLDSLKSDLAAEVIELREALTAVSREYDPSDGCNNAMTMHDIARAALNHKDTE